jgi:hypothetical protein
VLAVSPRPEIVGIEEFVGSSKIEELAGRQLLCNLEELMVGDSVGPLWHGSVHRIEHRLQCFEPVFVRRFVDNDREKLRPRIAGVTSSRQTRRRFFLSHATLGFLWTPAKKLEFESSLLNPAPQPQRPHFPEANSPGITSTIGVAPSCSTRSSSVAAQLWRPPRSRRESQRCFAHRPWNLPTSPWSAACELRRARLPLGLSWPLRGLR